MASIELPPGAQVPAEFNPDGTVSRYYTGLFNETSGNAYLKENSDNSVRKMATAFRVPLPRLGETPQEDLEEIYDLAVATGIGVVNIHMGEFSYNSGGCPLVGTYYTRKNFQYPIPQIQFQGVEHGVTHQNVKSLDKSNSIWAQAIITQTLYYARKCRGGNLNANFKREGPAVPAMEN